MFFTFLCKSPWSVDQLQHPTTAGAIWCNVFLITQLQRWHFFQQKKEIFFLILLEIIFCGTHGASNEHPKHGFHGGFRKKNICGYTLYNYFQFCKSNYGSWPSLAPHTVGTASDSRQQRQELQVQILSWPHNFCGDWSWKHFYNHSSLSVDSRKTVVSYWQKYVHKVLVTHLKD